MSNDGKQIKFQFVVDEQSAQRVNKVLDEMIKRAQELGKTLQGVGMGGGGGSGLLGGGTVGGKAPSSQSTFAKAAGSGTQKVSFASVLTQNVDMFKRVAQEGGSAMKVLGDAINRGAEQQRREIHKLQQSLEALAKTYDKLGGAGGKHAAAIQDKMLGISSRVQGHQSELKKLQAIAAERAKAIYGPQGEVPEAEAAAARPGAFARFRGWLNRGGGIGGQEVNSQLLSRVPGLGWLGGAGGLTFVGASAMAAGGVAAARQAAYGAYNAPTIAQDARLQAMSVGTSGYAQMLRAGDLSARRSLDQIQGDAARRKEFAALKGENVGGESWTERGANWTRRRGVAWEAAKAAWGRGELGHAFTNIFSGAGDVDYENVVKARNQEYIQKTTAERGVMEDIYREATSGALGKMGIMRALGIGSGRKKTGAYVTGNEAFLNAYGQFDPSEVIGAVQGIAGAGTRGAAYTHLKGRSSLLSTVLQAQAAGISGAANLGGVFSRQGAGAGAEMVDLLRSVAGAGTDVSTAGLIGATMAQHADQLNIPRFGGAGTLGMLSYGTQGAQGAMVARQNVQGMAEMQRLYSGARDPAQKAQNFLIARRVAPDAGFRAQQYLATGLDAGRVSDILAGQVELTGEEKVLGITPSMLRQQAWGMRNSRNWRTMAKAFAPGSEAGKMMTALQGGESLRDYARKAFAGKDQKWSEEERQHAIDVYATTLRAGDENMTLSTALGTARNELFGQGRRARAGKMVGDVAGGGMEAKQAREEAKMREIDRKIKDAQADEIERQIGGTAEAYGRGVMSAGNLAITASGVVVINAPAVQTGGVNQNNTKAAPKKQ